MVCNWHDPPTATLTRLNVARLLHAKLSVDVFDKTVRAVSVPTEVIAG